MVQTVFLYSLRYFHLFRWLVLDDCELAEKMKSPSGWFLMIFGWPVLGVS